MLSLRCPHAQRAVSSRTFSTTTTKSRYIKASQSAPRVRSEIPEYPYGAAQWYKQSDKGLYGGSRIQFGNNVSDKNEIKSRRTWNLNVFRKNLFSVTLQRHVRVKATTRVLRTIDKVGGLDEYILGDKTQRIKDLGVQGWRLRCLLMRRPAVRARMNAQREAWGLPPLNYQELETELMQLAIAHQQKIHSLSQPESDFEVEDVLELSEPAILEEGLAAEPLETSQAEAEEPPQRERAFMAEVEKANEQNSGKGFLGRFWKR